MNIIVCVKQILDPEIPMDKFRVKDNQVVPPEGIPPVISPYDAQAVEVALKLKDKHGGRIVAITSGSPDAADVVRHALSMGVDEGIVLSDSAFYGADSFVTAYILSQAIKKLNAFDLILCGREAADWNMGIAGPIMAEILNLPIITLAKQVELLNEKTIRVERVIPDGYQVFEVSLPAVVTISKEVGLPRLPTGWGIIRAAQQKIPVWTSQDIPLDFSTVGTANHSKLLSLSVLKRERKCEFIDGKTAAELAANLVVKLQNAGMMA